MICNTLSAMLIFLVLSSMTSSQQSLIIGRTFPACVIHMLPPFLGIEDLKEYSLASKKHTTSKELVNYWISQAIDDFHDLLQVDISKIPESCVVQLSLESLDYGGYIRCYRVHGN